MRNNLQNIPRNQGNTEGISTLLLALIMLLVSVDVSLAEKSTVTVGVLEHWPPQYTTDERRAQPSGFAVEAMEQVGRTANLIVQYKTYPSWVKLHEALKTKEIDVIPNIGITTERAVFFNFSAPIETTHLHFYKKKTSTNINSEKDLQDKLVSVVETNKGRYLLEKQKWKNLKVHSSLEEALMSVLSGKTAALVYPDPPLTTILVQHGLEDEFESFGTPLLEIKRGMCVHKDNLALAEKLNHAVLQFVNSPQYQHVYLKWHGPTKGFWTHSSLLWATIILLAFAVFFVLGWRFISLSIMNKRLKKSVKEREKAEKSIQRINDELLVQQKELKGQRDLFELVINSVPDRIFWKDNNLQYLGCNIHFAKDSGLDHPEEVVGKTDYDLVWKSDAKTYRADDLLVIKSGEPKLNFEEGFFNREGHQVWWLTQKMPLKNVQGEVIGVLATSENITEQKSVEEENRKLEEQLQRSQKMEAIGTLAGGIAHDFNNILAAVIGFTELALDGTGKNSQMERDLKEVYAAGLRAKDLVQQILTFARKSDEELGPIQVNYIIKEVLKFIRSSIPAGIDIKHSIDSHSLIMGSATQVHRVMMNLCTNAAHAMEESGGVLAVSLKDISVERTKMVGSSQFRRGSYIEIKVSDSGYGIEPHILDKIFDPYFTTKAPGEGTGMGLAMVHGIVKTYGGKIFVESRPGQGTDVTLYLPTISGTNDSEIYEENRSLPRGQERVLFVDDEEIIVKMVSRILGQLGYRVTTTTSSKDALQIFESRPSEFDLVISDVTMPEMGGDELVKQLLEIRSDIPVILSTGYNKRITEEVAYSLGAMALTHKPIIKEDLAVTVRAVLDGETK